MPQYCKACIHNKVCKHVEQVEKWEESWKGRGTGTDYKATPITIKCECKEEVK